MPDNTILPGKSFWLTTTSRWLVSLMVIWGIVLSVILGSQDSLSGRLYRIAGVLVITAFSIWLTLRKPRMGAVSALILSTIGLAAGIAVGVRFLSSSGFSWQALTGLAGLLAGIGLLVFGCVVIEFGTRLAWRLISIPVIILIITVLTWTFLPAFLATYVPHTANIQQTPPIQGAQPVYFTAEDGVNLFAWYIPPTNGAAVILRHGSGSTGSDTFNYAAVLVKHGYGVLITDARGHGSSSGTAMDFGWYGDTDINAAVTFLLNHPEVDPQKIAVIGLSMGGEEAVGAIATNTHIAAVVAEGATARSEKDKTWYRDVYGFRGSIQIGLEWLEYNLTDLLTDAAKPISLAQAVKQAQKRVLLITAGKIEDEQYTATYLQKQAPDKVTVWNIPEAGHIQGLSLVPGEWEATVTGFLDQALSLH
jgi:uncharacterized protein